MQFKNWVESERGRAGALAVYLKVPPSFVSKMVSGEKPIPVTHMAGVEVFSDGQVTRKEMRPDDWQTIWPELAHAAAPIPTDIPSVDPELDCAMAEAAQAGLIERRIFVRRADDRERLAAAGQGV